MEKYVNNIIRGFKKIFNKKYFAIVSVFIGIITVLGFSYGYLASESGWQLAAQLRISKLFYSFTINGNTTDEISVPANSGTTYYNVEITSLNDISTRYALTYNVSGTATVEISSLSVNNGSGIIGKYGTQTNDTKTRTVRIAVTNNSADAATIKLSVAGGYSWNPESQVALKTGYSLVSGLYKENNSIYGMSLADEVSMLLSCTPSASSPCLYTENANNYLTYGGYTWRIVGTYMISSEKVVKLILDSNYSTKVNYSSASSKLSAFYGSMSDTSLVRTASPFSCTAPDSNSITCSGSANYGHLSGAELTKIGNTASYLYTKPDEDYWLMQEGSNYYTGSNRGLVTSSSSATAFVRPSIYLKSNVLNSNISEGVGTFENPYEISGNAVQVTISGIDDATSNIVSGYLVSGETYPLSVINNDPSNTIDTWIVTGTGSSVTDGVLTMGTNATTLTAVWEGTYNYSGSYNVYTATVPGYYFVETYGAQGGNGSSSPMLTYGGYSSGYVYLNNGDKLYTYVGSSSGYNGGGTGYCSTANGGGATDIRYFGSTTPSSTDLVWNSTLGLNSRIMVAGGGGGNYESFAGGRFMVGYGGNLVGQTYIDNNYSSYTATGGSQTSGGVVTNFSSSYTAGTNGSFAIGGNGGGAGGTACSGGGGGGYYGGAGGSRLSSGSWGGGGGSSFISGYAGVNAITSATNRTHTNDVKHYSGKYFKDGTMKSGVRAGNGLAKVKYYGSSLTRTNTKLNGVRYIKDCINGSSVNDYNNWVELQAIKDGVNLAKGKTISLVSGHTLNNVAPATDGKIYPNDGSSNAYINQSGQECALLDLGSTYDLDEIYVVHNYVEGRTWHNNITYVSSNNSTWTEAINETIPETVDGKRISAYSDSLNGYIQDNLLVWYDGISNTGTTRSTSTTSWKNLARSSYNGAITSGTWGGDYLSLGSSSKVDTGINLVNNYTPQSNTTLEIVMKVTSWPNTNTQYGNAGIVFGSAHYGGYGITWSRATTSSSGSIFAHKRSDDNGSDIVVVVTGPTMSAPTSIASYTVSDNYSGNNIAFYTSGSLYGSKATATGQRYDSLAATSEATIGINNYGTYGGNYVSGGNVRLPMQVYSVRLYNKALTAAEVYHNYLIDKERFDLP